MGELIIFGTFILLSFVIGVYLGQKLNKSEPIELNPIKPIEKAIEEHKIDKKIEEANTKFDKMLENVDNYDGTGFGQQNL